MFKKRKSQNWLYLSIIGVISAIIVNIIASFTHQHSTNTALATADNPAIIAQPNKAFQQVIPKLEKELKDLKLTFSTPTIFAGKTLKEVVPSNNEKIIALTFDDGPWANSTEKILDILSSAKIKATFFMVGQVVDEYPQIAKKVVAQGHAVANHTYHHWYKNMDPATAKSEIERTATAIYKATGATTHIFRPPGGFLKNGLVDYAHKQKHFVAMWSSDSMDYRRPAPQRLAQNALRNAKPGGMILMHDGGGDRTNTVKALPIIIDSLSKQGYRFVTVPELLEIKAKEQAIANNN